MKIYRYMLEDGTSFTFFLYKNFWIMSVTMFVSKLIVDSSCGSRRR